MFLPFIESGKHQFEQNGDQLGRIDAQEIV
jgi:hypothetical protein